MTAADEPNILRLQSARTQHHTVCGFMVMDCALFSHMIGLMLSPARTARTTAMTQRVRALTAMAAGDEPNILRLWSARTQNHAVRGFGDRLNTSPTESSAPQRHRQHHMYNT